MAIEFLCGVGMIDFTSYLQYYIYIFIFCVVMRLYIMLSLVTIDCAVSTGVSKRQFSVLNSGIQVSFFRKLPLQNLVFLKFYSLNEEAVRTKI